MTMAAPPARYESSRSGSGQPDAGEPRRSRWQLLRHHDFRWYFAGSLLSNLGTWLQSTAQVILAYQLTHSVFSVGLVVSAQFVGVLLLSPWAAVIADRIGGRVTLAASQAASAVIAGLMAWAYSLHLLGEQALIAGALALGLAFSLALPLQTSLVPTLVEPADTEAAMAMNSVSYNAGRALAPALSVLVLAFTGPDLIFALNAASFMIFAIILGRLKPAARDRWLLATPAREAPGQRRARVLDGVKAARNHRRIMLLLAIVAAVTFADDPILVLSPGLAHTALHVSSDWAAYFIAALGWGTVLGSLAPARRGTVIDPSGTSRRAAWSLLLLALSVIVFARGFTAQVSLLTAFLAGAAALFTGAAAQALIVGLHRETAVSIAGLWAIAWAGTKPIASLVDGWLASNVGIWPASVLLACPAIALALCEIMFTSGLKNSIKEWSLTNFVESNDFPDWVRSIPSLLRLENAVPASKIADAEHRSACFNSCPGG